MPVTEIPVHSDDDLKQSSLTHDRPEQTSEVTEQSGQIGQIGQISQIGQIPAISEISELPETSETLQTERDAREEALVPAQVPRNTEPSHDNSPAREPDPANQDDAFSFTYTLNQLPSSTLHPNPQLQHTPNADGPKSAQSKHPVPAALPSPSSSASPSSSSSSLPASIAAKTDTDAAITDEAASSTFSKQQMAPNKSVTSYHRHYQQQYSQENAHRHHIQKHTHHEHHPYRDFIHPEPLSNQTAKAQHLTIESDHHRRHPLHDYLNPTASYVSQSSAYIKQHDSFNNTTKIPKLNNTYLKPNATFFGEQQSGIYKYHIKVEFKTVDLTNSLVTGFLQISGLTDEHPEITTCFKGEIINNPLNRYDWGGSDTINKHSKSAVKKYSFLTEHDNWGSFAENDLDHWKKLTGSYDLTSQQLKQKLLRIQRGEEDNQFLYMRWKEEFLLPDSRIKQISGASFEGFYYIVLNIGGSSTCNKGNGAMGYNRGLFNSHVTPGTISGLYYHTASDKFQSLSLRYVEDHGVSNTFEFV